MISTGVTSERPTSTGVENSSLSAVQELRRQLHETTVHEEIESADMLDRDLDEMYRVLSGTPQLVWDALRDSPHEKLRIIQTIPYNKRRGSIDDRTKAAGALDETNAPVDAKGAAERYADGPPAWDYVYLWDPPVGGFHRNPVRSKIHRSHIDLARRKGFTPERVAPILGANGPVCDMHSQNGVCGKKTLDFTDLLAHQKAKHPAEIEGRERETQMRQRQVESDRGVEQIALLQTMAERIAGPAVSSANTNEAALTDALAAALERIDRLEKAQSTPARGGRGQ